MSEVEPIKNDFKFNSSVSCYLKTRSSEMKKKVCHLYVLLLKGQQTNTHIFPPK